jgi:phage shock protein C
MKRLHKGHDRKIAGVCSGFAEYFNMDTTIVRLVWAVLILVYGVGLLAYIIAAFIMPNEA